jgi:hypothetical protein
MDCGNLKFSKRKTIDEKYLSDNQCDKFEEYSNKDRENFNYLSYLNGWNIRY